MARRDPYRNLDAFAAPAWRQRDVWRIAAVTLAFDLCLASAPDVLAALLGPGLLLQEVVQGSTPRGMAVQFAAYGAIGVLLVICVRLLHGRGAGSLVGPFRPAARDMTRVTGAVALVLLVQDAALLLPDPEGSRVMRPLLPWALWLVPGLLAVLLQTGTEELFFRGYLQQQLAVLSPSPIVWMLAPSLLFGAVHYSNGTTPQEGLLWAFWATLLGLACADLVARCGNLGPAIGLHLANNGFALIFAAFAGLPDSGLALLLLPDPALAMDGPDLRDPGWLIWDGSHSLLSVAVMWLAARLALRR